MSRRIQIRHTREPLVDDAPTATKEEATPPEIPAIRARLGDPVPAFVGVDLARDVASDFTARVGGLRLEEIPLFSRHASVDPSTASARQPSDHRLRVRFVAEYGTLQRRYVITCILRDLDRPELAVEGVAGIDPFLLRDASDDGRAQIVRGLMRDAAHAAMNEYLIDRAIPANLPSILAFIRRG